MPQYTPIYCTVDTSLSLSSHTSSTKSVLYFDHSDCNVCSLWDSGAHRLFSRYFHTYWFFALTQNECAFDVSHKIGRKRDVFTHCGAIFAKSMYFIEYILKCFTIHSDRRIFHSRVFSWDQQLCRPYYSSYLPHTVYYGCVNQNSIGCHHFFVEPLALPADWACRKCHSSLV